MRKDPRHIIIPATCDPNTRAMYTYWLVKCGERRMPSRKDIEPTEMLPQLLPGICIVDVVVDARRYVYRLVGTAVTEVRGQDPTGKSVVEASFGSSAESLLKSYDQVVATRAPLIDLRHYTNATGRYVTEETVFLPLSDHGEKVDKILVFSQSRDLWLGAKRKA
jgi:hypothetical protein